MTQEERKARMDQIKNELIALESSCTDPLMERIRLEKAGALQLEGRRLGDEFRAVRRRSAQQEAVAFVERLLDERSRNLPESDR